MASVGWDVWDAVKAKLKVPDNVERMVIDIPCDDLVRVYYQCIAEKDTLDVALDIAAGGRVLEVKAKVDDGSSGS